MSYEVRKKTSVRSLSDLYAVWEVFLQSLGDSLYRVGLIQLKVEAIRFFVISYTPIQQKSLEILIIFYDNVVPTFMQVFFGLKLVF